MRLIDADKLFQETEENMHNNPHSNPMHAAMHKHEHCHFLCEINKQPEIDPVHAAGAVYCKECKYCKQHHDEQTNETLYKCTKYSLYDFSDRQPNDFCSQGILKLPLQEEISAWLTERSFFADSISQTEFIMQQIYFDNSKYKGKEEDQKEIANNCKTVADAYYYVQTHELNVDKIYKRK